MPCERVVLDASLHSLTVEQQHVITLKFFGGLSSTEIATVLGCSEGAVRLLQYRALHHLQRLRSAEQGDSDQPTALPLGEVA